MYPMKKFLVVSMKWLLTSLGALQSRIYGIFYIINRSVSIKEFLPFFACAVKTMTNFPFCDASGEGLYDCYLSIHEI